VFFSLVRDATTEVLIEFVETELITILKSSSATIPATVSSDVFVVTSSEDGPIDSTEDGFTLEPTASLGLIAYTKNKERANVKSREIDVFL